MLNLITSSHLSRIALFLTTVSFVTSCTVKRTGPNTFSAEDCSGFTFQSQNPSNNGLTVLESSDGSYTLEDPCYKIVYSDGVKTLEDVIHYFTYEKKNLLLFQLW